MPPRSSRGMPSAFVTWSLAAAGSRRTWSSATSARRPACAALNYGHTFAHAFETVGGYGAWLHGEAVSAGMVCASWLAERRGLIGADIAERQRRLLQTFRLPIAPERWPVDDLLATMRSDKKAVAGRLRFVLPRRLGEVAMFEDVPESDVRQVLEEVVR